MSNQTTDPGKARGGFSLSSAFPSLPGAGAKAKQPMPGEAPPTIPPEAATITSEGFPDRTAPLSPAPIPHLAQHRRTFSRRVPFTFGLVLLIILSGSGLLYFASGDQRTLTLSPSQVRAATATEAAQAYATGIAKQGVMFGFNAAHTGYNPYEHTLSPGNVSHLALLWSFTTGGEIYSSPVVADGMVYVGSRDDSTFHGVFYVFDASCRKDCQPLWNFTSSDSNSLFFSAAIAGGMVYVGTDHTFYAFDASCRKACQPLWSFTIRNPIESPPAIAGGIVYVGADKLYAFDASCRKACQPLWNFTFENTIFYAPAIASGLVYVGSSNHTFYAFDASCRKDCQPLWRFTSEYDILDDPPVVAGGLIYVGSSGANTGGTFYTFDASCRKTCQPLWSFTFRDNTPSPAVAGSMVYINIDGTVYVFDANCRRACQPLWSFTTTEDAITSSPTVAGNVVYAGSNNGEIYAFDASCRKTCQFLWRSTVGDTFTDATKKWVYAREIAATPAVANGVVYVSSLNHKLCAFGLAS